MPACTTKQPHHTVMFGIPALSLLGATIAGMAFGFSQANAQATSGSVVTLPSIDVKSKQDANDGLRGTTTRVGKTLQDPHDIPQAITTITNSLMGQ